MVKNLQDAVLTGARPSRSQKGVMQDACSPELHSLLHAAAAFDLDNPKIHEQVKADYETIREKIRASGIDSLTGNLGKLVQARTKGAGYGSKSPAFYALLVFVALILNLERLAAMPCVLPDFATTN